VAPGLLEEVNAQHAGHALVGKQQGHFLVAQLQFFHRFEGFFAGGGAEEAVIFAVTAAQVAFDGPQHLGVVVHDEDNRLFHVGARGRSYSSYNIYYLNPNGQSGWARGVPVRKKDRSACN
jgi:hypothetical protein